MLARIILMYDTVVPFVVLKHAPVTSAAQSKLAAATIPETTTVDSKSRVKGLAKIGALNILDHVRFISISVSCQWSSFKSA